MDLMCSCCTYALSCLAANSGLVVPLLPFGMPKYDAGERFDLRSPYADDGWVVSAALGIKTVMRVGPQQDWTVGYQHGVVDGCWAGVCQDWCSGGSGRPRVSICSGRCTWHLSHFSVRRCRTAECRGSMTCLQLMRTYVGSTMPACCFGGALSALGSAPVWQYLPL